MPERPGRGRGWGDLALAALIVAVVAMMIVPLPRPLVDLLLAANLAAAVAMLLAAVFVAEPLRLASFPTILLVATLVRVGLNVSTTRLILAHADAGQIVQAFGSLVVADNLVVGLVVFALITVIQLVVVARGAERVAEVAARFALDALPGQQLAIDAEVRAGAIDASEAAARRGGLERASHLYGAMDGAMKFVKGDAIAAIVIVLVNLIGGLVIGIGYRDMEPGQAAQTYSLLSVGEGLVAQIPSLVMAIAAGLLVTRVASARSGTAIGDEIATQLLAQPRALAGAAALMVVLALVPGLPLVPFAALALVTGGAAVFGFVRREAAPPMTWLATAAQGARPGAWIDIELGSDLITAATSAEGRARIAPALAAMRTNLESHSGVVAPGLRVRADRGGEDALSARELRIVVSGTALAWLTIPRGEAVTGIIAALDEALPRIAHETLGIDDVQAMVERAAIDHPVTVREVVPRLVALPVLTEVVRALVREEVPVGDLPAILEAIAAAPAAITGNAPALADHVRGQLRRQISGRFAPRGQLAAWTVDGMIEDAVRSAIEPGAAGVLALEPALARDIVAAVRARLGDTPAIVLTSGDVRRHMRALLEPSLPGVAVLAPHELAPGVVVRAAGRIEV
ncbi:MAG: flagellar biosynthesis protein FlhA [Deltaproteobacteria bacterium]|nr:flagellar biosynthesis protein FlhA [Deltaproteobacteria bacterium]